MKDFSEDAAVARLAEIVALECGVHPATARQIRTVATLHDIGKQKIPGNLLNKSGKLTGREFEIVKSHTRLGAGMLASIQGNLGEMARTIALYHHERYDGKGYWGIRTCELPCYVPVVTISDVFVALISKRPYKSAWPPEEALDYIQNQAGLQFNPMLVGTFLALVRSDNSISALVGKECDVIARRDSAKDCGYIYQSCKADGYRAGKGHRRYSPAD